jgi:transposase
MSHTKKGDRTMQVERIGLDIAKSRFQGHGVDAHGKVVLRKRLTRGKVLSYFAPLPPCLVGVIAGVGEARPRRTADGRAVPSTLSYAPAERPA